MADDWAEKRAHLVKVKVTHDCYRNCTCGQCVLDEEIILTALREAEERGEQRLRARLQNPDEAMVEAVRQAMPAQMRYWQQYTAGQPEYVSPESIIRALADHLSESRVIKLDIPPMPHGTLAKWEHRDPATLYWLPVILKGPTGVTCWYVELPSGHTTIINGEDHAELVPVDSDTQEGE